MTLAPRTRHRTVPVTVSYEVPTWGVGELVLIDDRLVDHDLPSRRRAFGAGPGRPAHTRLVQRLQAYFGGAAEAFADVDLEETIEEWGLTPFEAAVTRALQAVPYGTTVSYGALAAAAGSPRAARAAGSVCARGVLGVILPYHRVIAGDGTLGSYGPSGVGLKRRLLALEGVRL